MHHLNIVSLLTCVIFSTNVLGNHDIEELLNDDQISKVKKQPGAANQDSEEDWGNTFSRESKAMLPFAKFLIEYQAERDRIKPQKLVLGGFISLVGQGGGTLELMGLLKQAKYNVGPNVLVVEPKKGRNNTDFLACMKIISKYGLTVHRVKDENQTDSVSASVEFPVVKINEIQDILKDAKFLAVALCGSTFHKDSVTAVLMGALGILSKLAPVGQTEKTVFSPGTPSGQTSDGKWPIAGSEHECTHVATLTWPTESVRIGNEFHAFVNVEKNDEGDFETFLELLVKPGTIQAIGKDLSVDVTNLQANEEFKNKKWVEIGGH